MTDINLSDLTASEGASEAAAGAAEAAGEAASDDTGEWLLEVFDRLEQRGLIEPILFGPDASVGGADRDVQDVGGDVQGSSGDDLDAEKVAQIGKTVIDTVGDVKISKLVKYAEAHPEQVNRLIDQKAGDLNED